MSKKLLSILFPAILMVALMAFDASAQDRINGKVLSSSTGEPISELLDDENFDEDSIYDENQQAFAEAREESIEEVWPLYKKWDSMGRPPISDFLNPKGKWRGLVVGHRFNL
jgi:hypothetical protein